MLTEDDELIEKMERRYGYSHPPYFVIFMIVFFIILMAIQIFKTLDCARY
jgi:hypothetical protein